MAPVYGPRLVNKSTGKGKVCVITGGASGIGAEAAYQFCYQGARVCIADLPRQEAGAVAVMSRIRQAIPNAEVAYFKIDVRFEDQWLQLMDDVERRFGPIDVMVNNAGMDASPDADIETLTVAKWERTFSVNSTGTFLGTKHAILSMKKNTNPESKSIVNTASIAAVVGGIGSGSIPYSSSKGAVRLLTKSTAMYCARKNYNIRCNSVHPGVIETPGIARQEERLKQVLRQLTPVGRLGRPEDIAYAMVFLASDESSFMTGSEVHVDGGFLAQ